MRELSQEDIESGLTTAWLGRHAHWLSCVGSTNDAARHLARRGAPDGTLVMAEQQTAGRGRLGRRWWAPPSSSLLMSLVFRPQLAPSRVQWLTMITGLACADGVEAQTGLRPVLKWPNDLLLWERKLAGILTELETSGDGIAFAVVGLGMNVNVDFRQQHVDAELQQAAIGLSQALGRPVDRLELLDAILTRLEKRYEALGSGVSPHEEWSARLHALGRQVRAVVPTQQRPGSDVEERVVVGNAVGVDQYGALLLRLAEGTTVRVLAGDVAWCES